MKTINSILSVGIGLIVAGSLTINRAAAAKPNFIVFYADDLGYGELGCYGNKEFRSPNIDALAANGVRCAQGYVSAPLCSPSRAGLMTGRYQTRFGHENNGMKENGGLLLSEVTLANRMKALGYATAMVGKWHLGNSGDRLPMKRGFDEYYGVTGNPGSYFTPKGFIDSRVSSTVQAVTDKSFYTTDAFASRAVDWLERQKGKAWFLYLPFNAVHSPHEATDAYLKRVSHIKDARSQMIAAMLLAMDDAVGRIMAKVRELGVENNTLVFFIADNGAPGGRDGNGILRGSKHTTWEGGFRVPFIVQWKGTLPAGQVYDKPVIQLDVMPTLVTAAGGTVDPAWKLDGTDIMPYLTGKNSGRAHETLCWRIDGMWAIRHGDMKLVLGAAENTAPELFDLAKDPGEKNNLATDFSVKAKELKTLWDQWNAQQAPPIFARQGADKNAKKAKKQARQETKGEKKKKKASQ